MTSKSMLRHVMSLRAKCKDRGATWRRLDHLANYLSGRIRR